MSSPLGRSKFTAFTKNLKKITGFLVVPAMLVIAGFGIYNVLNNQRTAQAASCTWSGDVSGQFSDAGNWSACPTGSGIPENGDDIVFPDVATEYVINNDINVDFNSITVESLNTSFYELSGNPVSVLGPIDVDAGTFEFVLSTDTVAYGLTGSGRVSILGGYTLSVGGDNNTYVYSGEINGSGDFNKVDIGIQTLQDADVTSSVTTNVNGYFLNITGTSTIDGELYNNNGGILFNGNLTTPNYAFVHNGGGINIGPGYTVDVPFYDLVSGNFGIDAQNGNAGKMVINNGTTNLNNGTFSMRFFGTYSVGQSFTVVDTVGTGDLTGEFTNFTTGNNIITEGWNGGGTSVINDVEISVQYTTNTVIVTIEAITPKACIGDQSYTDNSGSFNTGSIDYFPDSNCSWTITPANADSVTLDFTSFNTEDINDVVRVYDGLTIDSPLLGEFSGSSIPSSMTAGSGLMLVTFTSNSNTEFSGFSADWTSLPLDGPTINSLTPAFGPTAGGTSVTVDGTNFVNGQYQDIQAIGNSQYDGARGMVVDASGQYITGEFSDSITLGSTTLTSNGGTDIYIAKIDDNGDYVWAVSAGGTGIDGYTRKQSMYLNDADGTIMITGFYQNSADFGATTLSGGSGANIFIAKIDKNNGDVIWAKSAGGDTSGAVYNDGVFPVQYGSAVDVDSSGNIYFSGKVDGSSPSFDAISITLDNSDSDIFVAKMDSSGNFLWVNNYGATQVPANSHIHGLVIDSSDDIYATAGFAGSITIGATTLNSLGNSEVSNNAIFKLDSSGNDIWAVSGGTVGAVSTANDLPYDLALDSSQNLYLTGYYGGSTATYGSFNLSGSPASATIFTTQMDPSNGDFIWVSQLFSTSSFNTSRDMYIDSNDKIWIGGTFSNALTGAGLTITGSGANAFFAQYDNSGNLLQLEAIGGTAGQLLNGGVGGNQVRAIYEYNGKIYIAGEYFDTIGIGGQTITSNGDQDGFYTTWVADQTSIKIDGIEVQATYLSSTELSFTTPPNTAGFKDVVVTNSNGQSYTLSSGFEYQAAPEIVIADIDTIYCSPNIGFLSVTPSCTVDFDAGKSGTVTFTTSAGSCATNPIDIADTTTSCSFTISTPSTTPYQVDVSASGGGARYGIFDIYVSPLPELTTLTPNIGPTAGGTSTIADFSKITGQDRYFDSVKDSADNIYAVGHSFGTVDTGSGFVSGFGGEDILITKYDSSGNIVWSRVAGSAGNDRATGITIDSSNNIYVTGHFRSEGNFGGTILYTAGNDDIFVSKLNSSGTWQWSVKGGGFEGDQAQAIDIDSSNNVYIVGHFLESATFGSTTLTSNGFSDIVIAKLNSSGTWIWANSAGAANFDYTGGIAVNPIDNSIYVSGQYNNSTTFGATNLALDMGRTGYDGFLAKADSNGDWVWAKDIGNTGVDTFGGDGGFSNKVYSDASGNAYIMGGFFKDYIDFGAAGQITNSTPGDTAQHLNNALTGFPAQHYIAKSDSNGDWVWATGLGDTTYYFSGGLAIKNSTEGYLSTGASIGHSFSLGGTSLSGTNTFLNAVVSKINLSNGVLSNVVQTTGTGGSEVIRDLTLDSSDNLVLVGNSTGTSNYGSNSYISSGANDVIISNFDTTSDTFTSLQGFGGNTPFFVDLTPAANSLTFDALDGTITTINSPIRATVTTPAHAAGFVDVIATNSLTLTSTLNNGFQYIDPITNSNITSMVCSPSTTPVNTTVNCVITTNVNLNTLSGSVNVRIGTLGTIINCLVTGSGTTLNCNNIPVGSVIDTLQSQYNASGSGLTYANGNDITTEASGACTGTPSGPTLDGETIIIFCVDSGALTLYPGDATDNNDLCETGNISINNYFVDDNGDLSLTPSTCSPLEQGVTFSPISVSSSRQNVTTTIYDILFEDLTGSEDNTYTVNGTISNLINQNGGSNIVLGTNPDGATLETTQDPDAPTNADSGKLYCTLDPSSGTIAAIIPTPARTQPGLNNLIQGPKTTIIDTSTSISIFNTSGNDVLAGRYDIDGVNFKCRIPAYVDQGTYKQNIVLTVIAS